MACGQYLLSGESHSFPPCAALPETLYRPFAVCAVLCGSGNEMCNRLAVPGYGNRLPMLYHSQKFG